MPADYKDTVHLPRTDFPMKANLPQREPEILKAWQEEDVFAKLVARNAARPGARKFVLHDGPPYANGDIHIGHALNKILKDIIVKYHAMLGDVSDYVPGWDCHGLPIELKVDKELGPKKRDMKREEVILACRRYALKWIDKQREAFKRLGIFGRWEQPYLTMARGYEAEIVRTLARVAEKGFLYRGKKPVYWCIHDRTALAEAEVEYEDHTSPSIHVAFELLGELPGGKVKGPASLVVWTTTPWTLPANLAVCAHPDFTYVAYDLAGRVVVVAKDLLGQFLAAVAPGDLAVSAQPPTAHSPLAHEAATGGGGVNGPVAHLADPKRILAHLDGKELEGLRYRHPFMPRECPVILGEHVTLEAGTGLVHTAPGHGQEDYEVGLRYGLEVLNPVDGAGRFTAEAGKYAGRPIFEANAEIVRDLAASGHLLSDPSAKLRHSYPHCWRCHNPVVFRATDQWFLSLEHDGLRGRTLSGIDGVQWIPRWGRDRIYNMIEHRPDWCLSRQRTWGVPIPVFYCEGCGEPLVSPAVMRRVAQAFEEEGIEAWYRRPVAELVAAARCGSCGGAQFRREQDILDVWWDSGVSWEAVAEAGGMGVPVDLYLEGSDQHRGWFHSSLLTGMAARGAPPYRAVLTHGFVLDAQGKAMSKSLGNTVAPEEILKKYGADILRLWVASTDYRDDVRVGDEILAGIAEGYRKIRNTVRWALGTLDGFDPAKDAVPVEEMEPIDRWAVARLADWVARVKQAYADYEYHLAYHATLQLCAVELSALYFDIIKDRLYTARRDGKPRRSAQTALHLVAGDLVRMLAPILSFTAEEAWGFLPEPPEADSVFYAGFPERPRPADAEALEARYGRLFGFRDTVKKALEEARQAKLIGKDLEAAVTLSARGDDLAFLRANAAELPVLFIVSGVELAEGATGAAVARAPGAKCPRCWGVYEDVGKDPRHPELCGKCAAALA
ncbi:MAG TPA: isoleucine--tRNA ligase [Anaeromyxobacteraceae bacterium]|nr:isoleucine--tRNA ligase [Anaeromyxobacteraceae bacterium]